MLHLHSPSAEYAFIEYTWVTPQCEQGPVLNEGVGPLVGSRQHSRNGTVITHAKSLFVPSPFTLRVSCAKASDFAHAVSNQQACQARRCMSLCGREEDLNISLCLPHAETLGTPRLSCRLSAAWTDPGAQWTTKTLPQARHCRGALALALALVTRLRTKASDPASTHRHPACRCCWECR